MRGLNAFQMAQMKHRDARVFMLCQHLRAAIDVLEQIASEPFHPPHKTKHEAAGVVQSPPPEFPREKLTYTVKEAAVAIGVSKSTIYKAFAAGNLSAIKLGNRTLIPADALRAWMQGMPAAHQRRL